MPADKEKVLKIHPKDNVAIVLMPIAKGETLLLQDKEIQAIDNIPFGHKIALQDLKTGDKIIKYGLPIGSSTCPIRIGEHVHTHNIKSDYVFQDDALS
jgi:altronate hydrolase